MIDWWYRVDSEMIYAASKNEIKESNSFVKILENPRETRVSLFVYRFYFCEEKNLLNALNTFQYGH